MAIRYLDEEPKRKIRFLDEEPKGRSKAEKALNLGAAYVQGRTWGAGPKIAAGVGATVAKPILEGVEAVTGREAPGWGDLYRQGVDIYSGPVKAAREDNPVLAFGAELAGGGKSALQFGKSALGKQATSLSNRAGGALQKMGLGPKSSGVLSKMGVAGVLGEGAARSYLAAEAEPGQEISELTSDKLPVAGIVSAALPGVGSGYGLVKQKLTPVVDDAAKVVVDLAKKHKIPLGLDDISDSKFYKTLISEGESIPFSGAAKKIEKQLNAFNTAVAKTIGLDGEKALTPENMDKAYEAIGKQFDNLTKGKSFAVNDDVLQGLDEIRVVAEDGGYGTAGKELFDKYLNELYATIKGSGKDVKEVTGEVSGDSLAKLRSRLNAIGRRGSDLNAKTLAGDFEKVISDFISDGSPEALKKAKHQYKNFLVLEPLAQKSQVTGQISPAELTGRVKTIYGRQFTRGKAGDIGDLARVGQMIKQTVPNSGTSQRTAARKLLGGSSADMAAIGAGFYNPALTAGYYAAKGAGMAGNRALQSRNYDPKVIEGALRRGLPIEYLQDVPKYGALTGGATGILSNR